MAAARWLHTVDPQEPLAGSTLQEDGKDGDSTIYLLSGSWHAIECIGISDRPELQSAF